MASRRRGGDPRQALAGMDGDNVVDLTSEGEPQAGADAEAQATTPQEQETAPEEQQAAAGEHAPAETDQPPAEVPAAKAPDVGLEAAAETELGDGSQPAAHLGADVSEVGVD